jgi:hypothetical protein
LNIVINWSLIITFHLIINNISSSKEEIDYFIALQQRSVSPEPVTLSPTVHQIVYSTRWNTLGLFFLHLPYICTLLREAGITHEQQLLILDHKAYYLLPPTFSGGDFYNIRHHLHNFIASVLEFLFDNTRQFEQQVRAAQAFTIFLHFP